jgi:predicted acetyltransferase
MGIEIRNVAADELAAAIEVINTAFLERSDSAAVAEQLRESWDLDRLWVAVDGASLCGAFRSWSTSLTVPGGASLPGAAVNAVTVLPTHRRRGILRLMAAAEHRALVERGEVVGLLYSAEWPIYGRFGYAPGTRTCTWVLDARASRLLRRPGGTVELAPIDAATRDLVRSIFEAWVPRRAGEITRRALVWDFRLGLRPEPWGETWKGWVVVHRDDAGTVDGYARYHAASTKWEHDIPQSVLEVDELVAHTDDAYAGIVDFLRSIDLVATVKLTRRTEDEPLRWLLENARHAQPEDAGDGLWVRLFDVPRALEARTYEREATLVIEVVDDEAFGGTRRLLLDAGPDGATCRPTDRSPDVTLPVATLSGAYLGGSRLGRLVLAFGGEEHRPGTLAEAEALFRTVGEPACSTFF